MKSGRITIFAIVFTVALFLPRWAMAQCTITGNDTIECGGVTYRAVDDEAVYFVDLAAHNTNHPGVPLPTLHKTIADNYADASLINPMIVELTDYVDCSGTSHNFSDANIIPSVSLPFPPYNTNPHPNQPSRVVNIGGKNYRITAAPDENFATYYYSYDIHTGGVAGVPHLLMAESINDRERYTTLAIDHGDILYEDSQLETQRPFPTYAWAPPYTGQGTTDPWGDGNVFGRTQNGRVFGPDVGMMTYTGREIPIDNQPFNIGMIIHPKQTDIRVTVSTTDGNDVQTSLDGGAVSQIWLFKFTEPAENNFPPQTLPSDPSQERYIGIHITHPWYFYAHYGTPPNQLSFRQAGLTNLVKYMSFCGMNYIVFNAINGSDRSERAWYSGSSYFSWNSAGNLLTELPPIAEQYDVKLVPLITAIQKTPTNGLSMSSAAYQMNKDGDYTYVFGSPAADPLHPETQTIVLNLLDEIASRVASSSAVRGIGLRVNGKVGTCYTADQNGIDGAKTSGYSSYDLQQFKNDTGSGVPTSPPGTAYSWLQSHPTDWDAWINWRCQKTRAFWLACRDRIQTYRSDLILFLQCDLPSEAPGTVLEWNNGSGETPYNLLKQHGYDPNLFVNDDGIIISRGAMVAAERYFAYHRWGYPFGPNPQYLGYRDFHFASGLAELYRTGEGKASESYQVYWEEARHPYFEFGSPTDPSGYFRTTTPSAKGRNFYEHATMSLRRQDPDTMTWLGWEMPVLGQENRMRKFATAFRALPVVTPTTFGGTVTPTQAEVVARWYDDRLAVINDTNSAKTITLDFSGDPLPSGKQLVNVVTGAILMVSGQEGNGPASVDAEAFSLNTYKLQDAPTVYAADFDGDQDVDVSDFSKFTLCFNGANQPPAQPNCDATDLDGDNDVDVADYAKFALCFAGPNQTPTCP